MNNNVNITHVFKEIFKDSLINYHKVVPTLDITIDALIKDKKSCRSHIDLLAKQAEVKKEPNMIISDRTQAKNARYYLNQKKSSHDILQAKIFFQKTNKRFTPTQSFPSGDKKSTNTTPRKKVYESSKGLIPTQRNIIKMFVMNHYHEMKYDEKGKEISPEQDLLRNTFDRHAQNNPFNYLSNPSESLFYQSYLDILKIDNQMNDALSLPDVKVTQHEPDNIKYEEDKEIIERNNNYENQTSNENDNMFKAFFSEKQNKYKNIRVAYKETHHNIEKHNYTLKDISLGFYVNKGTIDYSKKSVKGDFGLKGNDSQVKAIQLTGPQLTIYSTSQKSQVDSIIDLRHQYKVIDSLLLENKPHILNGHLSLTINEKEITIHSLLFFKQIASLFISLQKFLINASYNNLKYISNPTVIHLDIPNEDLLNIIHWHNKLLSLTIHIDFIHNLLSLLEGWDLPKLLNTITFYQSSQKMGEYYQPETLMALFSNESTLQLCNIHMIDINYTQKIHEALLSHVDLFYESKDKRLNTTIPILNLSIKRSKESNIENHGLNLNMLYTLFLQMLYHMVRNHNMFPLCFQKLDISEQNCSNVEGLIKIITKFKMIQVIDVSNAILGNDGFLIDSPNFLSNIHILNNDHYKGVIDSHLHLTLLLNEINSIRNRNYSPIVEWDNIGFDLTFGVYPVLERIILEYSTRPKEILQELYLLFKRLKLFQGFSIPKLSIPEIDDKMFLDMIDNDISSYCENIFEIERDFKI